MKEESSSLSATIPVPSEISDSSCYWEQQCYSILNREHLTELLFFAMWFAIDNISKTNEQGTVCEVIFIV
jgi:hypothetical protein